MEALVYIANGLYLASYLARDMLRLRVLTLVAASCLVAYFWFRPEPFVTVVCWNAFLRLAERDSNRSAHARARQTATALSRFISQGRIFKGVS